MTFQPRQNCCNRIDLLRRAGYGSPREFAALGALIVTPKRGCVRNPRGRSPRSDRIAMTIEEKSNEPSSA